jgi:hypothetical protein
MDFIDGIFNLIAMIGFLGALGIGLYEFVRKKNVSEITFMCLFLGAVLFTLGNVLEKFKIGDGQFADTFSSGFMIFIATTGLYWIILPLIEFRLEKSNQKMRKIIETASNTSINVANIATELAASASEVNASSEEISTTTSEISHESQEVMASTDEIRKVMTLIKNVADQTNLLALNASIEAGRAGEYGRGFAVVADEVRKLAEESKAAVANTGQKIDVILNKIRSSGASMEGISASTEQQTASMEEISATANKLGNLAEDLKSSLTLD